MTSPIFSKLCLDEPETGDLLAEFLWNRLPNLHRDICFHAQCADWVKMQESANELKYISAHFGYPQLATIANSIESFIKHQQTDRVFRELVVLDSMIKRINLAATQLI